MDFNNADPDLSLYGNADTNRRADPTCSKDFFCSLLTMGLYTLVAQNMAITCKGI